MQTRNLLMSATGNVDAPSSNLVYATSSITTSPTVINAIANAFELGTGGGVTFNNAGYGNYLQVTFSTQVNVTTVTYRNRTGWGG